MIKNILRTITMMYVDINSAKTADSVNYAHCMMPRRPD